MELNKIYNEDCFVTMEKMPIGMLSVILTSPFYNTNKKAGKGTTILNTKAKNPLDGNIRYDAFVDNMSNEEYIDFTVDLFNEFDRVLNLNGCVLYNISYGAENTDCMFRAINGILTQTNFTVADVICWKKQNAFPNSCSPNRLTRIWEFVFVFCRKNEMKTFYCNKKITSYRKTGQAAYENIYNFIEAKNNDGACPYNKATYSSDLCKQLLSLYCPENGTVYDPFMGTGTTAVACKELGLSYIGSELSENQCKWAEDRLEKIQ